MSEFTSRLLVSPLPDGRHWELMRPFTYHVGSKYSRRIIRVAKGFVFDFASIPKVIMAVLPYWAKYSKASLLHDWLYAIKKIMGQTITRREADDIFLEAMLVSFRHHKSGGLIAHVEYYNVRWFGWVAWKSMVNRNELMSGAT